MAEQAKEAITLSLDPASALGRLIAGRVTSEATIDDVIQDLIRKGLEAERGILPPRNKA